MTDHTPSTPKTEVQFFGHHRAASTGRNVSHTITLSGEFADDAAIRSALAEAGWFVVRIGKKAVRK